VSASVRVVAGGTEGADNLNDRRVVFFDGPAVVVELAQWVQGAAGPHT
jgi:hypothetical protein